MGVIAGKVFNGRIEVEDFELPEGAEVTVYLHEDEADEELTPEQEAEIEESIAELERGEYVTAEESLRECARFSTARLAADAYASYRPSRPEADHGCGNVVHSRMILPTRMT